MSVHSLKPTFTDRATYLAWRASWKTVYTYISNEIRRRKLELKNAQRAGEVTARLQNHLVLQRADAHKMMTLLDEAKARRDRILAMHESLRVQNTQFPLVIDAKVVDVHFNKGSIEFAFLPKWTVKAQGKSYYVEHIDARMGFSTRELEEGSTRGMLRFRNVTMTIDETGTAILTNKIVRTEKKLDEAVMV